MRRSSTIALIAVAIAAAAIAIVMSQGDADAPRADGRRNEQLPAPAELVAMEREAVPAANKNVDPPIAPTADPVEPAAAPLPQKQDIAGAAKSLLDAGLSEEVVKGMIAAVEQMEASYRCLLQMDDRSSGRYAYELWLALWPDLGDMIRRGDVKPEIVAFPPRNSHAPKMPFVPGVTLEQREEESSVGYSLSMERWVVSFSFTSKSPPKPELFAKILDAARTNTK